MVAGQNVYEAGRGAPWNQVTQTTRYLVHPGVAGTVTCKGYIRTASLGYDDSTVRVASGEIRFADATIANQTNGQPIQASVATGLNVNSSTRTAREPSTGMFDLAPGFAGLSVFGDTEFQVCAKGFPCNATSTATTTAQFTLYVNQWKTDGSLCHSQTATVRRTVPNFTVATGNNCMPRFNAYVKTDWISGEPALVQGVAKNLPDSRGSTTVHNSDFGHVFAVPYT